jgi:2-polyprenyl-3-methyl-5-hydroxy-6-metoxy-1,4-benzoquinol methylase
MGEALPSITKQAEFWDGWNRHHRTEDLGEFAERQRDVAQGVIARKPQRQVILDVGCGTGWLGESLSSWGEVTGTDLSEESINTGRKKSPHVRLISGDFSEIPFEEEFTFIVSSDVIAHVADQPLFVKKVAGLLKPGGTFLLMTQNPFVWRRSSYLARQGDGQLRNWPSLERLRELLSPYFTIQGVSSIEPGGNRGVLFWVDNRLSRRVWRSWHGWRNLLERAQLGRELVIEAIRNGQPSALA